MTPLSPLETLVADVLESAKYRHVSGDVVRRIGAREIGTRRTLKEAIKETRSTLHQIAGAYQDGKPRYGSWLEKLAFAVGQGEPEAVRAVCADVMRHHASTAERLPSVSAFYAELFAPIAAVRPIRSVLDVACGLNPLAVPQMPLAPDAVYHTCDIHTDQAAFLNACFPLLGIGGEARVCDVLSAPPTQCVDVALVLKLLPVLEQWDRNAGRALLHALHAEWIVVSYPTRSLGGRGKGMAENYAARFLELVRDTDWTHTRYDFANELCFVVHKPGTGSASQI